MSIEMEIRGKIPTEAFLLANLGEFIWEERTQDLGEEFGHAFSERANLLSKTLHYARVYREEKKIGTGSFIDFLEGFYSNYLENPHKCTDQDCRFLFDRAVGFVNKGKSPGN